MKSIFDSRIKKLIWLFASICCLAGSALAGEESKGGEIQIYISADWSGNSKLIVIPNMTHELPNRKHLNIALDYLNATDG